MSVNPVFVYIVMSTPGAMLALGSMAGLHDGPRTYRFLTLPLFTTYLYIIYLLKSVATRPYQCSESWPMVLRDYSVQAQCLSAFRSGYGPFAPRGITFPSKRC